MYPLNTTEEGDEIIRLRAELEAAKNELLYSYATSTMTITVLQDQLAAANAERKQVDALFDEVVSERDAYKAIAERKGDYIRHVNEVFNDDVRYLRKWLNEEQTAFVDRIAVANVLHQLAAANAEIERLKSRAWGY